MARGRTGAAAGFGRSRSVAARAGRAEEDEAGGCTCACSSRRRRWTARACVLHVRVGKSISRINHHENLPSLLQGLSHPPRGPPSSTIVRSSTTKPSSRCSALVASVAGAAMSVDVWCCSCG